MTEEWRAVIGFEGAYEVSNLGRVRSLDRYVTAIDGRVSFWRGRILRGSSGAKRYRLIILHCGGGEYDARYVHDMVALAFIGPKPEGLLTRHKNDDPIDNAATNLCYGTQLDNMDDADKNGLRKFNEAHHSCVYSVELIAAIRDMKGRVSSTTIERTHGISARHVRGIWANESRTRG